MTRESTDVDTAEQVIDSFRILAADKVHNCFVTTRQNSKEKSKLRNNLYRKVFNQSQESSAISSPGL